MPESVPAWETPDKFRYWPNRPQLGMLAFLASLTIFFGALVLAYGWVIQGRERLQSLRVPPALWWSTWLLCASGFVLIVARWAVRRAILPAYRGLAVLAALLGLGFLVSQFLACLDLAGQNLYMTANPHGSMFYVFTGFHALHLAGGLAGLALVVGEAFRLQQNGGETPLRRARLRAQLVAYYWNFVVLSWLVLFWLLLRWA